MSVPIPNDKELQTPAQQLYVREYNNLIFLYGDWHLNGRLHLYSDTGELLIDKSAELRFGKHHYMRGFRICMRTTYQGDDKHSFTNLQFGWVSQTISGIVRGQTAVFYVYPYQVARLLRLQDTLELGDGSGLQTLIGTHIHNAET